MERLDDIGELRRLERPLHVAIGVFDGVHIGHQAVLRAALEGARADDGAAVMVTFDPHPIKILRPSDAPRILTHTRHKLRLVAALGLDAALVIRFDAGFARRDAETFVRDLSGAAHGLRRICVGQDWKFGRNRQGDVSLLRRLGAELGFAAEGIAPVACDGAPVSSTRIRGLIREGEFDAVARLLGRPYTVLGEVQRGRQLGRTLGVPTANLAVFDEQLPPGGVYAVSVRKNGAHYDGIANLGSRPTVDGASNQRVLEVHLFRYDGPDFYGEDLEVTFLHFLRPEKRFPDLEALRSQIERDIDSAKTLMVR